MAGNQRNQEHNSHNTRQEIVLEQARGLYHSRRDGLQLGSRTPRVRRNVAGINENFTRPVLLVNIAQLLTMRSDQSGPRRGAQLRELGLIENGAVLCAGGKIISVGKTSQALRDP